MNLQFVIVNSSITRTFLHFSVSNVSGCIRLMTTSTTRDMATTFAQLLLVEDPLTAGRVFLGC